MRGLKPRGGRIEHGKTKLDVREAAPAMRGLKRFAPDGSFVAGASQRSRPGDAGIETRKPQSFTYHIVVVREAAPAMRGLKLGAVR